MLLTDVSAVSHLLNVMYTKFELRNTNVLCHVLILCSDLGHRRAATLQKHVGEVLQRSQCNSVSTGPLVWLKKKDAYSKHYFYFVSLGMFM